MKKKITIISILAFIIPFLFGSTSYTYSYFEDVLLSTPGMNYATHFNPQILGVEYTNPKDFVVYEDTLYMVANGGKNTDYLIVLNEDFEKVHEPLEEFNLSPQYAMRVRDHVDELFAEINDSYLELIENKVFYPGQLFPVGAIDPFIGIANMTWDLPVEIENSGLINNYSSNETTVELSVTMSIWDNAPGGFEPQTQTYEYTITIGNEVEGIKSSASVLEPKFEINHDVLISNVNLYTGSDFNETIYDTISDLIDNNKYLNLETNEFEYEGFIISYDEQTVIDEETEEESLQYTDISTTKIVEETEVQRIHSSFFEVPYKTNNAYGIDVTDTGIYIADRNNYRILKLNHNYEVVDTFFEVEDETFNQIRFEPLKVTVDPSERMYVVANNVYEGIIELDSDGSFNRYTGVNPITLTPAEALRRLLMTEAQRAKLQRFLPTSFTNVALNDRNFIFATALPRENEVGNMVQLISPKGIDVLVRSGYHDPMGDIEYVETKNNYVVDGPSILTDVAIGPHGIYSVLDQRRSRIFTYDSEGNLLYINGEEGSQSDKFKQGVALNYLNDDLVVLDAEGGTLVVYRPTAFGAAVNKAVELHRNGEFEEAALYWEDVLRLNTNYEIAYNGIGKYNLRQGDYSEAMKNFKLGKDKDYYSKAFVAYRNEILKENFGFIMLGITLIAVGIPVYIKRDKIFKKRKDDGDES